MALVARPSLPIARRDTERLRQLLSLQGRIGDLDMSPRAKRALMHRGPFEDALTWFEVHGHEPVPFGLRVAIGIELD